MSAHPTWNPSLLGLLVVGAEPGHADADEGAARLASYVETGESVGLTVGTAPRARHTLISNSEG